MGRLSSEALRLAAERPNFRLLLTDLVMPGIGGRHLYERIARPGLGVIFMSGYAAREGLPEGAGLPWVFLQKPFSLEELESTVREVLESTSPTDGDRATP